MLFSGFTSMASIVVTCRQLSDRVIFTFAESSGLTSVRPDNEFEGSNTDSTSHLCH
jgi:hypothetical protein